MTDTPVQTPSTAIPTQSPQPTNTPADPIVENLVTQALDIQNTFTQNDTLQPEVATPTSDLIISPSGDQSGVNSVAQDPIMPSAVSQTAPVVDTTPDTINQSDGKSPLDILEEILGKSEEGVAESVPAVPEKSDEQMKAEHAILLQQQQELLEEQRKILHTEVTSGEQQQRDVIRQEQQTLNQVATDHDIYQIKREKIQSES